MSEVGRPSTSIVETQSSVYYPGPDHTWERKQPEAVGIDAYLLQEAIAFANDPAHAGSGDAVHGHVEFLQRFEHADVCCGAGRTAAEDEANLRSCCLGPRLGRAGEYRNEDDCQARPT